MADEKVCKDILRDCVADISPEWLDLINIEKFETILKTLIDNGEIDNICPKKTHILEAFRYSPYPSYIRIVIIGQDPYPDPTNACGLSFSVSKHVKVPASLANVYKALYKDGHLDSIKQSTGVLKSWAIQGVLLLNRALTTIKGQSKIHKKLWTDFTNDIIKRLCERTDKKLIFFLWGRDAQELKEYIPEKYHILMHSHPSPLCPTDFSSCKHFSKANEILIANKIRPIEWNILSSIFAWTDGACPDNAKKTKHAGFGLMISNKFTSNIKIYGKVEPHDYIFIDDENPFKGFKPNTNTKSMPTNNRGELLAMCWALYLIIRLEGQGIIELITDSEYSIGAVTKWYSSWIEKEKTKDKKNLDLIKIAYTYYKEIEDRSYRDFNIIHQESHQPEPDNREGIEYLRWKGNQIADELAVKGVKCDGIEYEIRNPHIKYIVDNIINQ